MTPFPVNEWLCSQGAFYSVSVVVLSKCCPGALWRSQWSSQPQDWEAGDLSSSSSSATYLSSHKLLSLCDLHFPHLRNEAVVLYDLAGFFSFQNSLVGLSIMESAMAVFFIFSVYHRYYSESTTAWIQMWSVSVTKTALKRKLLALTAIQPWV